MRRTIKSKNEINALFRHGTRVQTASVLAIVAEHAAPGRIAVIAGKRLGNAPQRNRAKRLIREAACKGGAPWAGYDVLLIARERLLYGSGNSRGCGGDGSDGSFRRGNSSCGSSRGARGSDDGSRGAGLARAQRDIARIAARLSASPQGVSAKGGSRDC
jgi:ribonuclease P protein component